MIDIFYVLFTEMNMITFNLILVQKMYRKKKTFWDYFVK